MTQIKLILGVSLFLILFSNYAFFQNVIEVYSLEGHNIFYFASVVIVLFSFLVFLFTLLSSKYTTKPILITVLLVSAFTSYFMNSYSVVIDAEMIRNSMQTNLHESLDLLNIQLFLYLFFLGLIPAYSVYKIPIEYRGVKKEFVAKLKSISISLIVIVLMLVSVSKFYTSFFREHKPLRYYTNPTYWMYSVGNYVAKTFESGEVIVQPIGLDAKIEENKAKRKLTIMVVGEATRADHFSLNGYKRETNPLLKKENIVNFSNFSSCGTSTAVSVPCMFSIYGRSDYSYKKGIRKENVLDVLAHTKKVSVLWRDNNSDSKGVAIRLPYENYQTSERNTVCIEGECRDEGMLVGLDTYIENQKENNILIVLHQMGNHGPAYYKRYVKEFENFTPVCQTNQLEECSQESINNAYDNALLYTDYFLSKVINLLKTYTASYETTMIYMSDHGESLGEGGIYLHGMPYFMAPDAQTHVATLMWFGDKGKYAKIDASNTYSQDNLFHTLLGLYHVKTDVYNSEMDILNVGK